MRKEDASVTNIGFVNSNADILLIYFKKTASSWCHLNAIIVIY